MVLTELQRRKLTRFFTVYDLNGDGFIRKQDYEILAENIAHAIGFTLDSPLAVRVKECLLQVWANLEILADKNADHKVTLDEFLEYRARLYKDDTKYGDLVNAGLAIFDLVDSDQDGRITVTEFAAFYSCFNLDAKLARAMFDKLDVTRTGFLSRDAVLERGREFNLSDDPDAPGNWLFGPF